jgi:hypothetical protein
MGGLALVFVGLLSATANQNVSLARKYLQNLDSITTPEQRAQAVLSCLAQIAAILDKAASRAVLEEQLNVKLRALLQSVDVRDRDMKSHFQRMRAEMETIEEHTRELVNRTDELVRLSMKSVRGEITRRLREYVDYYVAHSKDNMDAVSAGAASAAQVSGRLTWVVGSGFLIGIQAMIVIGVYLFEKHMRNREGR